MVLEFFGSMPRRSFHQEFQNHKTSESLMFYNAFCAKTVKTSKSNMCYEGLDANAIKTPKTIHMFHKMCDPEAYTAYDFFGTSHSFWTKALIKHITFLSSDGFGILWLYTEALLPPRVPEP